jgi:hypothetical protein
VCGTAVSFPEIDELVLGPQFFFLHIVQGGVVHRQHSQFRIADLAVEFLVPLVKAAEFRIALYQHFDVFLLVLEHQPTSCLLKSAGRDARFLTVAIMDDGLLGANAQTAECTKQAAAIRGNQVK